MLHYQGDYDAEDSMGCCVACQSSGDCDCVRIDSEGESLYEELCKDCRAVKHPEFGCATSASLLTDFAADALKWTPSAKERCDSVRRGLIGLRGRDELSSKRRRTARVV